jgi:hypothetical protein
MPIDKFANKFFGTVAESAANTLTFAEIQTSVSLREKMAWVLHRLEYHFTPSAYNQLVAADDRLAIALTGSNALPSLSIIQAAVIDLMTLDLAFASAVGRQNIIQPILRDFCSMPGGGLIIAPRPLYIGVQGTSLAAACGVTVRGYYTEMELKADEYLELVDFYRMLG